MKEKSILEMVGGEKYINPHYNIKVEKMKDEEMAEEYTNNLLKGLNCNLGNPRARQINSIDVEEAFLAGLKAGRPQWHKVADGDLPKKSFYYWICYAPVLREGRKEGKCYCKAFYDCNLQEWETNDKGYLERNEWICKQVIAWCEIPTFDKE